MKKRISKNNEIRIAYYYSLNDGTAMRQEAIEKKKKRFKQLYVDTAKHEQDVRKWIESGTRKKGDIRRSLERLYNKYQELANLNDEFERKGISELKLFNDISKDDKYNLIQLENKINRLYDLVGIKRNTVSKNDIPSIYGKEIELVTDIPSKQRMFGIVKKNKNIKGKKEKNKFFDFKKLGRRVASFVMAISIATFAGPGARNTRGYIYEKQKNSYTDTKRSIENEKESFRQKLYVGATEIMKQETIAEEKTKPTETQKQNETKKETTKVSSKIKKKEVVTEKESDYYLAKAGTKYTEVSDGSGNVGYFNKDTEVKVYNRALVKTDKKGNRQILKVTRVGQTWKEYAEEKGLDYEEFKEYMNNNKNIKKYVSLDSIDETKSYGWVLEDTLEKTGEMER